MWRYLFEKGLFVGIFVRGNFVCIVIHKGLTILFDTCPHRCELTLFVHIVGYCNNMCAFISTITKMFALP
jgi:hypothetical protein